MYDEDFIFDNIRSYKALGHRSSWGVKDAFKQPTHLPRLLALLLEVLDGLLVPIGASGNSFKD